MDQELAAHPCRLKRMTTAEFVAHLCTLDIRVSVDGERLRCSVPKGMLTDGLREELAARKVEILAWLRANADGHDVAARAPAAAGYHEPLSFAQQRLWGMEPLQPGGVAYHIAGGIRAQGLGPARMPREGGLPLSFAQQRLWFLDQLEPGTSAYTIAVRRRFHGPLDVAVRASAGTALVRRHESLRTTFVSKEGQLMQRIVDPEPVTLGIVDLERHAAADRDRVAGQIVREEAQRPFDLARGPLFRPVLLRLEPDEHELLVSIHHIVADGWSLGILARELDALYEASVAGRPSALPELPIQYADFALWQRRWLTGEVLETQRRYWREQLGGRPAPLELPTDHPRSSWPTCAGASHDCALPRPLADRLRELSRCEGATPFMTLLAAFKTLLARYTGQEDIVVGTAVANRNYVELEPVVGLFANTLALRTDLAGDPTFRELLARVRETCLDAYAHPDMPFEKLVEELQPERTLGQNPLFQVSFVWQDAATVADLAFVTVASPFDLTLFVRAGTDGMLSATVQYKRDLFEPETMARLVGHYCTLLEGVAADPDCRLSALPRLSDAEARLLLIEWNATNVPGAAEATVPRLIEAQAAQTPEAIAVSCEGQPINYRELNRRANRLAHHLRRLDVGPSVLVGVFVERSAEMLIAVLAVMKVGGAYVPLDPAYPTIVSSSCSRTHGSPCSSLRRACSTGSRSPPSCAPCASIGTRATSTRSVRVISDGERRLVSYVVGNGSVDAHDLREFLGSKLPDYMIPTVFVALDRLPLTANGKVDRQALPAPEASAGTVDSCTEPRDELERQLVKLWQDVLSVGPVGIRDNFFDLGGHSLLAVRMFAQLQEQLRVTLPLAMLFQAPTIAGLAALIRGGARPALRRSLVPIQPTGSRPPVFGMPGVGGTVLVYNALARLLGPDQPFYRLQSRGLDGLEEPLTRIEDIAAEFLREIRAVQPEGPYYLVGMCMGGVVAYEMAQQLRAAGQEIGLLVLLETWSPEMASARQLRLGERALAVLGFVVDRLRLYLETLARLRGRERLRYLLGRLKRCTEIIVRRDLFRGARGEFHLGVVTRANLLAFQQYKPRVYPGPAVLFCAEGRKVAPAADYRLAWREFTTGGLEVYSAPGEDSGLMLTEPHVQLVAAQLKTCLERAQTSSSPRGAHKFPYRR